MFKLTRDEHKRRTEIEEELAAKLEEVIMKIEAYNRVVEEAREFTEEVSERLESEFDEKSDRWRESDRAERVREWMDELSSNTPEELTVPEIETEIDAFRAVSSGPMEE